MNWRWVIFVVAVVMAAGEVSRGDTLWTFIDATAAGIWLMLAIAKERRTS